MLKIGQKVRWAVNDKVYTIKRIGLEVWFEEIAQEVKPEDCTPVSGLEAMQVGDVIINEGGTEMIILDAREKVFLSGWIDCGEPDDWYSYEEAEADGWQLKESVTDSDKLAEDFPYKWVEGILIKHKRGDIGTREAMFCIEGKIERRDIPKCDICGKPFIKRFKEDNYHWIPTCKCSPDLIKSIG